MCGAVPADPVTVYRDSSEGTRANDHILVGPKRLMLYLQTSSHLLTRKTDALASVVSDRCVVEGCGVGSESTVVSKRLHYSRGVHSCAVVFQWMLKCLMEHLV